MCGLISQCVGIYFTDGSMASFEFENSQLGDSVEDQWRDMGWMARCLRDYKGLKL